LLKTPSYDENEDETTTWTYAKQDSSPDLELKSEIRFPKDGGDNIPSAV
jgi:hypothetical protein